MNFMMKALQVSGLLTASLIASMDPASSEPAHVYGRENEKAFARGVDRILADLRASGRVYYYVACQADQDNPVPFPSLSVDAENQGEFGLAALRHALRKNNTPIAVSEDPPDIVRVTIGKPVQTILDVKIAELILSPTDRYDYVFAIMAVLNNSDVKRAMRDRNVHLRPIPLIRMATPPLPDLPHLPEKVEGRTVDEIFDIIAQTFGGTFVYGACADPLQFDVRYYSREGWE